MKNVKRTLSLVLALVMCVSMLAACGDKPKESTATPQTQATQATQGQTDAVQTTEAPAAKTYKKKIVLGEANPMTVFDPQAIMDNIHCTLHKLTFNQLIGYDFATREILPELAIEWKAEDASTYWFKLRQGVKFSNGEEMTADDVKYTFIDRVEVTGGAGQKAVFANVDSVDVINDYEVRIHLKKADSDFLNRMYITNFSIINREACEADPDKGGEIGTGGWILTEFVASDHASFKRFDDSWVWGPDGFGEINPTEEIEVKYMAEGPSRAAALQAGTIAATSTIKIADYEVLEDDDNLKLERFPAEVLDYLILNAKNGPCSDKNVRLAIAYALNIDEINVLMQGGMGVRAYTLWSKGQYGYFEDFGDMKLEQNVDKAKEYLAKSGYPNGCDITIYVTSGFKSGAELIQAQLKKIGINMKIEETDKAGMTTVVEEGVHDAIYMSITLQSIGDRFHFVCNTKSATNRALYENPDMLAKFDAAMAEVDDAKRLDLYKQIQIELNEEKPYIPFFYEALCVGAHKEVEGIQWSVDNKPDYTNIRWPEN